MGDQEGPDAQNHVVADRDQMWARRLQYAVVADPHAPSELDAAPSMKPYPQGASARRDARQVLEDPVLQSPKQAFAHEPRSGSSGPSAGSASTLPVRSISRMSGHAG